MLRNNKALHFVAFVWGEALSATGLKLVGHSKLAQYPSKFRETGCSFPRESSDHA